MFFRCRWGNCCSNIRVKRRRSRGSNSWIALVILAVAILILLCCMPQWFLGLLLVLVAAILVVVCCGRGRR